MFIYAPNGIAGGWSQGGFLTRTRVTGKATPASSSMARVLPALPYCHQGYSLPQVVAPQRAVHPGGAQPVTKSQHVTSSGPPLSIARPTPPVPSHKTARQLTTPPPAKERENEGTSDGIECLSMWSNQRRRSWLQSFSHSKSKSKSSLGRLPGFFFGSLFLRDGDSPASDITAVAEHLIRTCQKPMGPGVSPRTLTGWKFSVTPSMPFSHSPKLHHVPLCQTPAPPCPIFAVGKSSLLPRSSINTKHRIALFVFSSELNIKVFLEASMQNRCETRLASYSYKSSQYPWRLPPSSQASTTCNSPRNLTRAPVSTSTCIQL